LSGVGLDVAQAVKAVVLIGVVRAPLLVKVVVLS